MNSQFFYRAAGQPLLHNRQRLTAHELLHDLLQRRIVQLADGRQALRQDFAVRAVRPEDVIIHR